MARHPHTPRLAALGPERRRAACAAPVGPVLLSFGAAAVGFGAARALTTTYVPVLLSDIHDAPWLIGLVMLINAVTGFTVPFVVGTLSDRRRPGRFGRRGDMMLLGALVTAGGLVAVAAAAGTTYVALGLSAAAVYIGLNAATTAHRAVVGESFDYERRARATSVQELGALAGALVGTVAGGVLIDRAPGQAFLLIGAFVLLALVPTIQLPLVRRAGAVVSPQAADERASVRQAWAELQHLPQARSVLTAQILWVAGYGALPTFLVIYADHVLGLSAGAASGLVVAFGVFTGLGTIVAGRLAARHVEHGLIAGVTLMGVGALAAIPADTVVAAIVPFAVVAFGEGLSTALGYPYFTRFFPAEESGRGAGLFFSVRSIGSAIALPLAGGLAALAGYRWIWALGGSALLAIVPLLHTMGVVRLPWPRVRSRQPPPARPAIDRLAVIVPYLDSARVVEVAERTAAQPEVERVLLVDDGAPPQIAAMVDALVARRPEIQSLRMAGGHGGKAAAVAAALTGLDDFDAVMVVDSDAQHPPERIGAFVATAEHADIVVGNRFGRRSMPVVRRIGNAISSALLSLRLLRPIPDSQNGMRLYRRQALSRVPLPPGGFDVETTHLVRAVRGGLRVAWVRIPAIYNGEPSAFRAVIDTLRVARVIGGGSTRTVGTPRERVAVWAPRLGLVLALSWTVAALLPVIQPLDNRVYLLINHLGDGPDWLYDAVDPHVRNYMIIIALTATMATLVRRQVRAGLVAGATVALAGVASDFYMQLVRVWTNRPRPEEVLGDRAWLSHGRDWSHIASFPSGHLVVTSAMVAAAISMVPRLRYLLIPYLGVIAATRILFGAHFPSDVLVGLSVGLVSGIAVADLSRALQAVGWRRQPVVSPAAALEQVSG